MFSYLDTQLSRLGGPNFAQIPINRPHAPINDMLRDGMHQSADQGGVAPYKPNSLDGGCPFTAGADMGAYVEVPQRVAAASKVRQSPSSFADHLSQPRQFWLSLSPIERDHTIDAFTFELAKCYETPIRQRQLQVLANVDPDLCAGVAAGLGLPAPQASQRLPAAEPSPALSQVGQRWPTTGRTIGIITDQTSDLSAVRTAKEAVTAGGMVPLIIAPNGGTVGSGADALVVQRTFLTARSVEFDAILVAGGPDDDAGPGGEAANDPRVRLLLSEAFRHAKAMGGWGQARTVFTAAGCGEGSPGLVLGQDPAQHQAGHRVWDRFPARSGR